MALAYTEDQLRAAYIKVYEAVDLDVLKQRCQQEKRSLFKALNGKLYGTAEERHAFLDKGALVLAVAHLDTVQTNSTTFGVVDYPDESLVFNPCLDDRLGAYTILDLMPALGIQMDTLFTDNEERGATTAANFKTRKQYNWIVSFDRRGEDVVTYQYTWDNVLREYFTVGHGSFSCIGKLDHLGCQAMNVGVGYRDEHNKYAYFRLQEYMRNVARFLLFYERYATTHFPYEQRTFTKYGGGGGWGREGWGGRGHDGIDRSDAQKSFWNREKSLPSCHACGTKHREMNLALFEIGKGVRLCERCFKRKAKPCTICSKVWLKKCLRREKRCPPCEVGAKVLVTTAVAEPLAQAAADPVAEIMRDSRANLMEAVPNSIAFCEVCWEPRTAAMLYGFTGSLSANEFRATCGICGSPVNVGGEE